MTRTGRYILVDRKPVECTDLLEWSQWFGDDKNRRVAENIIGNFRISTVFLGLDHNFIDIGPPILFETIVFVGKVIVWQERYPTWGEAMAGHQSCIKAIKGESCLKKLKNALKRILKSLKWRSRT